MKNKIMLLLFISTFGMIGSISVGYSAFNTDLAISGEAKVKAKGDIMITNIEFLEDISTGREEYNGKYSKSMTELSVNLPDSKSKVSYRITITNNTSKLFLVNSISEITNSNRSVNYTISGLEANGAYSGSSYSFIITFTTSLTNQTQVLTLKYDFEVIEQNQWTYSQLNYEQNFKVPYTTTYKIEAWGAQSGASESYKAGSGAYVSGNILLNKNNTLYIHVGANGNKGINTGAAAVYNGGGAGGQFNTKYLSASGGGSTDIRTKSGAWNDITSLRSRIMVAGAGGGALAPYDSSNGNAAGGLTGYSASTPNYQEATGGNQTTFGVCPYNNDLRNGAFGIGGSGNTSAGGAGGGGGYYGGAAGWGTGGGGGSSYISGHTGCVAVTSESNTTPKSGCTTGTSNNSCSIHYSNLVFTNTKMIDGNGYSWTNVKGGLEAMPKPSSGNYPSGSGNTSAGYVRISIVTKN